MSSFIPQFAMLPINEQPNRSEFMKQVYFIAQEVSS